MGFGESVRTCLRKYAEFSGRARRSEYWWFWLACFATSLVLGILDAVLMPGSDVAVMSTLFSIAILLPSLAAGVRRLHDTDRSGWWLLIAIIPVIGWIVILVLLALAGTNGPNRFGDDPKAAPAAQVFA